MDLIFLRYQQPHPICFRFIKTFRPAFVEKVSCNIGFWPDSADHSFIYSKTLIPFFFFPRIDIVCGLCEAFGRSFMAFV